MEPKGSLPHSQESAICVTSDFRREADQICSLLGSLPATCPYPEPQQYSPRLPIPLLEDPF